VFVHNVHYFSAQRLVFYCSKMHIMSLILIVHIVMYAVNTRISVADMLHFPALDNSYISIA
jgi:hypothetical protein